MLSLLFVSLLAAIPQQLLDSGQQALQAGDLSRAEQLFREYLKTNPASAEALSNLAAVHARREQFGEAVALYEKALSANPQLIPVHFNMAVSLGRLQQYRQAADHLRVFLKYYPQEARAHQLLGLCLVETGDLTGAVAELEISYKGNPKDSSILYALAFAQVRAGNPERAAELLARSEAIPSQARMIQGLIEYQRGRFEEARVFFEEVVNADPNHAAALAALGRLNLLAHHDAEAIGFFERALKLSPADSESTYQLGVLYDRNGRTPEGMALLRRALKLRANYPDPHYQLGRIAFEAKDYRSAVKALEEARRLLPDQEAIRLMLGRTYRAVGREAEAKVEFAEVRRLKTAVIEKSRLRVESDALMK